jgi:hypothetical protein
VNPVDLVRLAGAAPPAGAVLGDHDIEGDRMSQGTYPSGESMTVYTADSPGDYQAILARNAGGSDDGSATIVIPRTNAVVFVFAVEDMDVNGNPVYHWSPALQQVAKRVGGQIEPQG